MGDVLVFEEDGQRVSGYVQPHNEDRLDLSENAHYSVSIPCKRLQTPGSRISHDPSGPKSDQRL